MGKMPRAEGFVSGKEVGRDVTYVTAGGDEPRKCAVDAKRVVVAEARPVEKDRIVINEGVNRENLPRITKEEFAGLHSTDGDAVLAAEEAVRQKIRASGIDPGYEGVIRILVNGREVEMAIGSDFGTMLKED